MGNVLLVDAPNLAELLRERGNPVHETGASDGLEDAFNGSDGVDAVVVGPTVRDPIQYAQRAYRLNNSTAVVLLGEGDQCQRLVEALRFSPFVGSDVTCSDVLNPGLSTTIEGAVERTRVRRKHRATVAALRKLMPPVQTPPGRAPDRELFAMQLLDMAPIGIVCLDSEQRVANANVEAARLLGLSERELVGQRLNDFLGDVNAWQDVLTRSTTARATATFERVSAASLTVETSAVALAREQGFLIVLQDVTERRRSAEARELALERAEEANRLKDEFVAMISHELRTPLNAVVGWTRLLRSGALAPEKVAHALEVIERNADAQVRLVEDLLDLSRIVTGKMRLDVQSVSINQVLQQTVESVHVAAAAKRLSLDVDIEPELPELSADRERLQQVFWNLLSNAVKFTERNGRVRAKAYQHGSVLRIEVSDDGEGIRPEALAYVFDPFRQAEGGTTRSHGGLGLGLAVVRRLVELHGGRVTAESAGLGQGSTFTVELPIGPLQVQGAADEGVVRAARASLRAGASNHELKEATILVVDDEPDARELIAILVKGAGGQVRTASSSADAMTQLATETVDLIVSDIGMPDEDGYAFVRRVRGLDGPAGRVPVIALTAYAREQERTRALAAGFDAHLSKPIAPDRLLGLIATLLKSHAQSA